MTDDATSAPAPVTLFASFSGQGGVEKMLVNLARGFGGLGRGVRLVLARADSAWLRHLPAEVQVHDLARRHTFTALLPLAAFLRRERPRLMLVAKDRAIKTAVIARWLSGADVKLVGRLGTNVSGALAGRGHLKRLLWWAGMRWFYPRLDGLVVVSEGVRQDVLKITGMDPGRVRVIRNPVITRDLMSGSLEPPGHPWLAKKTLPVIIGIGRLTRQKDFHTLIAAFARVSHRLPCRLLILGEGGQRDSLIAQARTLGVGEAVDLPGFRDNPYPYIAHADLFVLSSRWEGSPNALTEAMALGTPVVATDCPSGPSELLQGGRIGPLVPVGDADRLAAAMIEALTSPQSPEVLRNAVTEYTMETSAGRYLGFFDEVG